MSDGSVRRSSRLRGATPEYSGTELEAISRRSPSRRSPSRCSPSRCSAMPTHKEEDLKVLDEKLDELVDETDDDEIDSQAGPKGKPSLKEKETSEYEQDVEDEATVKEKRKREEDLKVLDEKLDELVYETDDDEIDSEPGPKGKPSPKEKETSEYEQDVEDEATVKEKRKSVQNSSHRFINFNEMEEFPDEEEEEVQSDEEEKEEDQSDEEEEDGTLFNIREEDLKVLDEKLDELVDETDDDEIDSEPGRKGKPSRKENETSEYEQDVEDEATVKEKRKRFKKSEVDDKFFNLNEMEEFLDEQDKMEEKRKLGKFDGAEKLSDLMQSLEEENLQPRSWDLAGEVTAADRGRDELLDKFIDVDFRAKAAPIITTDTTVQLESIIVQRIKDKAFDDVARKVRQNESLVPMSNRHQIAMEDQVRKSLATVYEEEFKEKQKEGQYEELIEPQLDPEVESIQKDVNSLFKKLDALSHYQFKPQEIAPEVKIVNNMPTFRKEEVGPLASAEPESVLLAPEEVMQKTKAELKSQDERTETDKKRERRKKKKKQRVLAAKGLLNGGEGSENTEKKLKKKKKRHAAGEDEEAAEKEIKKMKKKKQRTEGPEVIA